MAKHKSDRNRSLTQKGIKSRIACTIAAMARGFAHQPSTPTGISVVDLSNVGEGAVVPGVRVADDDWRGARSPRVEYRRDLGLARHAAPLRTTLRNAPPTPARLCVTTYEPTPLRKIVPQLSHYFEKRQSHPYLLNISTFPLIYINFFHIYFFQ